MSAATGTDYLWIKGAFCYSKHANALLEEDEEVDTFLQSALAKTQDDRLGVEDLVALALETGKYGVSGHGASG